MPKVLRADPRVHSPSLPSAFSQPWDAGPLAHGPVSRIFLQETAIKISPACRQNDRAMSQAKDGAKHRRACDVLVFAREPTSANGGSIFGRMP
jgi:hypothetical protein